jgi:hypothetical protein
VKNSPFITRHLPAPLSAVYHPVFVDRRRSFVAEKFGSSLSCMGPLCLVLVVWVVLGAAPVFAVVVPVVWEVLRFWQVNDSSLAIVFGGE